MEKKPISLKQLGKRLVMTSVTLLDNLFNDDLEKQQTIETYRSRLSEAARDQDLVVLQLQTEKIDVFETIVGYVASKNSGNDNVVIKMQKNQHQLRIVPLHKIEKVSVISMKKKKIAK